ncbi:hypothetical protein EBB07_12145 [Paenibacillaceae bacterium]|nr:hypothetical protein EBB07_12145 [Paenibacillaceae bacterium]
MRKFVLVHRFVLPGKLPKLKSIMITLLFCLVIVTVLMLKWGFEKPPLKATWIWETTNLTEDKDDMLAFAQAQGINVIFLHIDRKSSDFEPYRAFVEEAHGLGIEVEALGGDPTWGLARHQQEVESFVAWIEDYQRTMGERAAFDGIHVDIEPYLLKEWEADRDDVMRQWMENVEYLVKQVKQGSDLRVSADLPFWLHKIDVGDNGNAGAWMIEQFDRVVLMNYRNFAIGDNGIVTNALPMIREGTLAGKPVIIGLETAPTNEGEHVTFFGQSVGSLHQQMQLSHFVLRWHIGYAGFSIHDYKSWKELTQ